MTRRRRQAPIAVVGAAGRAGRHVLGALRAQSAPAWALVRRPDAEPVAVAAGAAGARLCDYADRASLARALVGIERLMVIPPGMSPTEDADVLNTVAAAHAAGVRRVVLLSVLHPHKPTMRHHMRKAAAEHGLRCSGLDWTILQPAIFSQSPLSFMSLSPPGEAWAPFDLDAPFTPIDLADVADVAAATLLDDGHRHASYELAGAERLSFRQMAAITSQVQGRPLTAVPVTPSALAALAPRLGARLADFTAMCEDYSRHGMLGNANVARLLLGREPTSFHDVVCREARRA